MPASFFSSPSPALRKRSVCVDVGASGAADLWAAEPAAPDSTVCTGEPLLLAAAIACVVLRLVDGELKSSRAAGSFLTRCRLCFTLATPP